MDQLADINPLSIADGFRETIVSKRDKKDRSALGQYMTPPVISQFMASMFEDLSDNRIRLLDPGSGIGSLSASVCREVLDRSDRPRSVHITSYEIDPEFSKAQEEVLTTSLAELSSAGVEGSKEIYNDDFILTITQWVGNDMFSESGKVPGFTHVIMNPPYKKIRQNSAHRRALSKIGIETSNLYTAFLALSILLLEDNGELVAIVPRSFCNGTYFRPFRKLLHDHISLKGIHIFHSRKQAFKDDEVLQENIIIHGVKGRERNGVKISSSRGLDVAHSDVRNADYVDVIDSDDPELFLKIATTEDEQEILNTVNRFDSTLTDLGIDVLTGPVVDFRLRDYLKHEVDEQDVPLLYTVNFDNGVIRWPVTDTRKPQGISRSQPVDKWLLENDRFVVTKRFSSKEERRRVVACVYEKDVAESSKVGFENHLNVFHKNKKGLDREFAVGLCTYLNSSLFDNAFRIFSGHTQVNATDLRNMRYPSEGQLKSIAEKIGNPTYDQERIDTVVESVTLN